MHPDLGFQACIASTKNVNSLLNFVKAHQTINRANPTNAGNTNNDVKIDSTIDRNLFVQTD